MRMTDIIRIINKMGLSWTIFRVNYELKRKTGILKKKFPPNSFSDQDFVGKTADSTLKSNKELAKYVKENRNKFFFSTKNLDLFTKILCKQEQRRCIKIPIIDISIIT